MAELSFPKPVYFEPQVGDWVTFWTGTAHKLIEVEHTSLITWLTTLCGLCYSYDVDGMTPAGPSDRRCKRCEKGVKRDA